MGTLADELLRAVEGVINDALVNDGIDDLPGRVDDLEWKLKRVQNTVKELDELLAALKVED
jgi:hypothetical protein